MTTVLISGANRGLGLEFARRYLADGATVIAGVRDPASATELNALGQETHGRLTVHALDVADSASVKAFAAAVGDTPVDILIANAGVGGGTNQMRLGELDYDSWLSVLNTNTLGPVRLAEAFRDNLKRGQEKKLIAITSQMGSTEQNAGGLGSLGENVGGFFAYRSSKAALNNAWKGISVALAGDGIAAVVLHPGWVQTDMGGKGAHLTPEQSITGMVKVIAGLTPGDTGRFINYDGAPIPW